MIVKNEAERIGTVLAEAAGCCDELVVLDTGSTDDTVAIARSAGAVVYDFAWIDDFAAARNASFDHCTGDWIMWLDGDDRLPADAQQSVRALIPTLSDDVDVVYAQYRTYATDSDLLVLRHDRERFLRRSAGLQWVGPVHEVIAPPAGRFMRSNEVYVEHHPVPDSDERPNDRNIKILLRLVDEGDRSPRTLYYLANEYRDHGQPEEAIKYYKEYLTVSTLAWERYDARLYLANNLASLERHEESYAEAMTAISEDPSRAGAYVRAALHHYGKSSWAQAAPLFLAATTATRPPSGFSSEADYTYLPWDFLGVCYYRLGRQQEALAATAKAIALGAPDLDRLRANLRYIADLI
jgi:glycosyltransferase involved in cell wall biosynthesis